MPLSPELLRAYERADYVVFGEPELVIHVGEPNPDLDALMQADGAAVAAYITAANPFGESQDEWENKLAMIALTQVLGDSYACYSGEGRDPTGEWSAEPSLLVIGISRADAEELGRRYEQNAIVFIEKGGVPELVVLA
jgi:hypothetical protein